MKNSIGFIIVGLIIFNLLLLDSTLAQNETEYDFVDTLKISEAQNSPVYIIKTDTSLCSRKYDLVSKILIFELNTQKLIQEINDTSYIWSFGGEHYYEDINLDGYKDIVIHLGYSNLAPSFSFWLYDETKNEFFPGIDFNVLNEYDIDKKTKIIESQYTSVGGMGFSNSKYSISGNSLILLEYEDQRNFSYKKEQYLDGKLSYSEEIKEKYDDEYPNGYFLLEEKKIIYDTLLVSKKEWIIKKSIRPNLTEQKNKVIVCNKLLDCHKYLKREKYNYTFIDNKLIADTTYYIVEINKWIKQK